MSINDYGLQCLDRTVLHPNQSNCGLVYARILPCWRRCVYHFFVMPSMRWLYVFGLGLVVMFLFAINQQQKEVQYGTDHK